MNLTIACAVLLVVAVWMPYIIVRGLGRNSDGRFDSRTTR